MNEKSLLLITEGFNVLQLWTRNWDNKEERKKKMKKETGQVEVWTDDIR